MPRNAVIALELAYQHHAQVTQRAQQRKAAENEDHGGGYAIECALGACRSFQPQDDVVASHRQRKDHGADVYPLKTRFALANGQQRGGHQVEGEQCLHRTESAPAKHRYRQRRKGHQDHRVHEDQPALAMHLATFERIQRHGA